MDELKSKSEWFETGKCWCCNTATSWKDLIAVAIPKERWILFGRQRFVHVCPKCYIEGGKNDK